MRWWYIQFHGADDFKPVDWWPTPPPEGSRDEDQHAAFKDAGDAGRFDDREIVGMFVADDSGEQDRVVWTHNVADISALSYFRDRRFVVEREELRRTRVD